MIFRYLWEILGIVDIEAATQEMADEKFVTVDLDKDMEISILSVQKAAGPDAEFKRIRLSGTKEFTINADIAVFGKDPEAASRRLTEILSKHFGDKFWLGNVTEEEE